MPRQLVVDANGMIIGNSNYGGQYHLEKIKPQPVL
jgi:hypothetical protein